MTVRHLKELTTSHMLDVIFLVETKCNDVSKTNKLISFIGFHVSEFVPSIGKMRRLLLMWKDTININVVFSN